MMQVSSQAIEILKKHEGKTLKPYKDGFSNGVQNYSIGFGHQIKFFERDLHKGITEQKAIELLKSDLSYAEQQVNKNTVRLLSQNKFDALVSFYYNYPAGSLQALKTWNTTGSISKTVVVFNKYVYWTVGGKKVIHTGLVARRKSESNLFATSEKKKII